MDPVLLSRIQFGLTICFHYIYPPLSIGLGLMLVIMEGLYLKTGRAMYKQMALFWGKIFGLTFAIGVATGLVMEFEFGTNWAEYSRFVGDVFGSALAAEGIFAFFIESGFLAIMLFGWNRVGKKLHYLATVLVALGAHFSAFWIVVADSWMQTPAGFKVVGQGPNAHAVITNFWAVVFNPSSLERLAHVLMGCWQAGITIVLSVSAYDILRKRDVDTAKVSLKIALVAGCVVSLLQLYTGSRSALIVSRYQPAKLAAIEGHYARNAPGTMYLFGWVDEAKEKVYGVGVPGMLSYLAKDDFHAPLTGLRHFPVSDRPPVNVVFQTYHLMIAIGMALIVMYGTGLVLWLRRKLYAARWLLWIFVFSVAGPQIANQIGWMTTEIGRQPWLVYGFLRTSQGVSGNVPAGEILASLILFTFIYAVLFCFFIYLLNDRIQEGYSSTRKLTTLTQE